ncbi:hypothetical protein [Pseudaestuariivita rosea]|uniref:hypothetical protein n=1 Tax=Pseudaestuariivita rosea TaxID=2763263 RepID=UPI001ABBA7D4|nr:hypothetical protein [Pseudaestuariivita rosea]
MSLGPADAPQHILIISDNLIEVLDLEEAIKAAGDYVVLHLRQLEQLHQHMSSLTDHVLAAFVAISAETLNSDPLIDGLVQRGTKIIAIDGGTAAARHSGWMTLNRPYSDEILSDLLAKLILRDA